MRLNFEHINSQFGKFNSFIAFMRFLPTYLDSSLVSELAD